MAYEFAAFMVLALALGFKHSYDADHLVAVSNLITRSGSLRKASLMSMSWAVGHMVTAAILTVVLYTFRETLLTPFETHLELVVAGMLVIIGAFGLLWEFNLLHVHEHMHGLMSHRHLHSRLHRHLADHREHTAMFSIGIVHGLASNDELLMLFVLVFGVATLGSILLGVAVFSVGVVAGMILFSVGLNYPILRWGTDRVRHVVNTAVAVLSIVYAALLFAGFGGFNPFPSPI